MFDISIKTCKFVEIWFKAKISSYNYKTKHEFAVISSISANFHIKNFRKNRKVMAKL